MLNRMNQTDSASGWCAGQPDAQRSHIFGALCSMRCGANSRPAGYSDSSRGMHAPAVAVPEEHQAPTVVQRGVSSTTCACPSPVRNHCPATVAIFWFIGICLCAHSVCLCCDKPPQHFAIYDYGDGFLLLSSTFYKLIYPNVEVLLEPFCWLQGLAGCIQLLTEPACQNWQG